MQKSVLSLFILCCSLGTCLAQNNYADRYRFISHLETIGAYSEGLLYIDQLTNQEHSTQRADSLNYLRGRFSYLLKNREDAIQYFQAVSPTVLPLFNASRLYSGLESAYLKDYDTSKAYFNEVQPTNELESELQNYQIGALALLNRDYSTYESLRKDADDMNFHLKDHLVILDKSYLELVNHKPKSPAIAGLMSAVIPGSGKMYNGQFGQGIMTLVTASIFGLQAYEGYRKNGVNSAPFIAFGSLFTLFHISNIYGSVVAVRLGEKNFNNNQNESILLRMHIPIRVLHN
ncbi:MAG: hypothetical protein JXR10_00720 [Cyclobacteriaceae bacterium]